eukprot:TRINITY_DN780_c0_g2_i4.p1 TRINITY_DN780_c0_g2~~TRINITY_DN780_c0_g2_i4.p1  ORF type:complete len:765 (-),score=137.57 TRINITY_DN780_c0_g2_i4:365-2659(-)
MLFVCIIQFLLFVSKCQGTVWPKPQKQQDEKGLVYLMDKEDFRFQSVGFSHEVLGIAFQRYLRIIFETPRYRSNAYISDDLGKASGKITQLDVDVRSSNLQLDIATNESYILKVASPKCSLRAETVYGALRGLETFAQLTVAINTQSTSAKKDAQFRQLKQQYLKKGVQSIEDGDDIILDSRSSAYRLINGTTIHDWPRFPHRGFMIDTSRHFLAIPLILKQIDALAMNKMNVLHWHMLDDQSFPFQSESFPSLVQGAYAPQAIYAKSDIQNVIRYGELRGVRVYPEIDTPGHTKSWGVAYPDLLTTCYDQNGNTEEQKGPINPIKKRAYDLVAELINEVMSIFVDKFFHLGGDEVNFDCWKSNPEILQWMDQMNIATFEQLQGLYIGLLLKKFSNIQKRFIVWQEVFDNGVAVPNGTVIQVWKAWLQEQNLEYANLRSMQILGRPLADFQQELEIFIEEENRLRELQAQGVQFSVKVIKDESGVNQLQQQQQKLQQPISQPQNNVVQELNDIKHVIVEQEQRKDVLAQQEKKTVDKVEDETHFHGQQEGVPQHVEVQKIWTETPTEYSQPRPIKMPDARLQMRQPTPVRQLLDTNSEHIVSGKIPDTQIQQTYEIHKPDSKMMEVQRRLSSAPYLLELEMVVKQGLPALLSAPWYLDLIEYGEQWKKYYEVEPHDIDATPDQKKLIIGGETCLWGEYVDVTNFLSRAWPRACAVAERLWSAAKVRDVEAAGDRLVEHTCRMRARGFLAEPIRPSFCPLDVVVQ